jgi:hypothetical protein
MALLLTLNSVNRVQGDTNDLIFTVQWPPRFNGVDGRCWRVCVRSFAMPSSTSMNTPWAELRLRVGSAESYNSNNEHGVVTHVIPISAATGQLTEVWTEIQSLTPEISASLHDSDGNFLAYQAPDKTITLPGEWVCQLEFQPSLRLSC